MERKKPSEFWKHSFLACSKVESSRCKMLQKELGDERKMSYSLLGHTSATGACSALMEQEG